MAYPGPFPFKVQQGGTGEITLAANAVLIGENTTDIAVTNVGTNGQLLIAATGNKPQFASLTSTGGTVTFTPGMNSLNLEAGGGVAITFDADTGTATPAANTLNIVGGTGISTTGAGNTITIDSTVVGGIQTINGNVGSVTGTTVTLTTGAANDNGTVKFTGVGTTMTMTYEDGTSNIGLGDNALKNATVTSSSNIAIGTNVFSDPALAASNNLGIGISAGVAVTTGASNLLLGNTAGQDITTGSFNLALGFNTLNNLITGSRNIVIGESSGLSYTGSESSNIIIGWQTPGTLGESNALRIGKATGTGNGEQNKAFIHGIDGINVGSVAEVVTIASDQLGSAVITAGTGITVTPGANTITITNSAPAATLTFAADSGTATPAANIITIAGGTNVTTSAAGSTVTIDASGGSSFTWNEETGTSASMAVNNGYIANNAGLVTLTLPTTAAVGDVVRVTGKGAGGWRIAQNAGETIYFGVSATTTGVAGSLDSTQQRDSVELVCVTANNDWNVLSSIGNLSVV